jgi:hypothetical protein
MTASTAVVVERQCAFAADVGAVLVSAAVYLPRLVEAMVSVRWACLSFLQLRDG